MIGALVKKSSKGGRFLCSTLLRRIGVLIRYSVNPYYLASSAGVVAMFRIFCITEGVF